MRAGVVQLVLAGVVCVALAVGAVVVVFDGSGDGGEGPQTTGTPPGDWETYANDTHGFALQYPSSFTPADPAEYPVGIPGNATALFLATDGDRRIVVGHTDRSPSAFRRGRSDESVALGEEAGAEFSAFEARQIGGSDGYEFRRTWYSGTGAGSEGISCRGLGGVTGGPDGGTVYVVVERCSSDIDDHPPITDDLETTFERILASFERTG